MSNGIEHFIPQDEWENKSNQIKNCILDSLEQYKDVKGLYINVLKDKIEFESFGTVFLTLRWENNILHWYIPENSKYPITLFADEIRACFWPTLNFIFEDREKQIENSSWPMEIN